MSPGSRYWSHVRPFPVSFRCGTGLIRLHIKPHEKSKYCRPHVLHRFSPPTYTGRFVLSWLFVFIASSLHNYKNYAGSSRQGFRSCPLGRCPADAVGSFVRGRGCSHDLRALFYPGGGGVRGSFQGLRSVSGWRFFAPMCAVPFLEVLGV